MDPHFIARAEAQRWLGIAEKLLLSHDLVGSKTFAIRARESDPRLEAADQILAIADTLLAAEKRVVGNNGNHQPDYYAILQLVRFVQDTDQIASQYRRLAVVLNPHQNRFPYADQAFQLVNDAWAVLSNPMRKSMYDSDLDYEPQQQMNTLGFSIEQQHHNQQQAHNFFSINQDLPEQSHQPTTFQSRLHQSHQQHQHQQLQQHNFLSQSNQVRPMPVREQEHMFQHREQEQLFQVTSPPRQQARVSPQGSQSQGRIQSPSATSQGAFSWQMSPQQFQHQQIKQEQQHEHHIKQEQHLHQQIKQEQQFKQQQMQQEQLRQQKLQEEQQQRKQQQMQLEQLRQQREEQLKQQRMMEEQRKQQQLQEEQRKQQQMLEEQRKQQQLLEEQRKQQQMLEEQRKQQQLLEEQRKQQQMLEEQRKQQQLLEEQRKQQQLLEEQRRQKQLEEERRKQQQILEEQRKQQQILEEQRKQQQILEEQRKQQQLLEEQRKQQQLLEEQRKQQQLLEEQRKQQEREEEQRKQQQLLEEQRKQQQLQEEQRKQQEQQQETVKHNAAPFQLPSQVNNNGVRVEETQTETEPEAETEAVDDSPTFWTACPYCFYMYEYPKVYVECTLRCDNCKRAFQAVRISSPPPIIEGQDAYFYCWGFIPVGLSLSHLQNNNNKGRNASWTPFSSLHNVSNNNQNHLNEQAAPKENPFVNKSSGPRIYLDDITDDVFIGVSEPSSDSDTEWVGTKKKKPKKLDKGFKERIQVLALRAIYTGNGSVKNLKHDIPVQKGVEVPAVLVVDTGKKNARNNSRKQSGQVAQELGKLDLNVEFNNNESEETASRKTVGICAHEQGEEENGEGNEFFEGLDEYLSSLPIISVVNEAKIKLA